MQPTRLWHTLGGEVSESNSGQRRKFIPDEEFYRKFIAAVDGEWSAYCDTCGNRVKAQYAKFNEQRWNMDQTVVCAACIKYGDPHGRLSPRAKPDTPLVGATFEVSWFKIPVFAIGECEVCHDEGDLVYPFDMPAWLHKAGKRHVCRQCNALAKEM